MKEIFLSFLKEKSEIIEKEIDNILNEYKTSPIYPALTYSIKSGGKRLRPTLLLASYSSFKEDEDKALNFAIAIEFIHTYSLIHDDLPPIDNAETRRGKPSLHKVFGEDIAILAGDAFLTLAFEIMSRERNFKEELVLKSIYEISNASGINGMVGGQVMDVMTSPDEANEELLYYIHSKKTGSLIKASLKVGALLSGTQEDNIKIIEEFGEKVGLSYQILDDIEDAKKESEDENRVTFPKYFGLEKSKEIAKTYLDESLKILESINLRNDILKSFVFYLKSWLS
ncbi:MAG: polyprenyl synthetase family protein [Caldisericia bacterium]|jgi:geranylgeranyl diphosphate synthase type II|nr:polyprenyl synthetase family protein [Caldisericia bacterium]